MIMRAIIIMDGIKPLITLTSVVHMEADATYIIIIHHCMEAEMGKFSSLIPNMHPASHKHDVNHAGPGVGRAMQDSAGLVYLKPLM